MSHANATLTPTGRLRLAKLVVDKCWTYERAAERFSVSASTARRWAVRYRDEGVAGMVDRSSRPLRRCPRQLSRRQERRIIGLRVSRRWGPHRIGYHLGVPPSTVQGYWQALPLPRLKSTRPSHRVRCGQDLRAERTVTRRPHPANWSTSTSRSWDGSPTAAAGDPRPSQAGTTEHASAAGWATRTCTTPSMTTPGYAYSEIHADERKETAAAFWRRASACFADHGITIQAVLTDNGNATDPTLWAEALGTQSSTDGPGPTDPRPTGRSNGSTGPCSRNGPTSTSTAQKPNAPPPTPTGSITTITTAATPHSTASHPQTA